MQAGGGVTGEAVKGTWDEINRRYICGPFWNGMPGGFWGFNATNDSWQWMANLPHGWDAYKATACRMGRAWCLFVRPTRDQKENWPARLLLWNLDSQRSQGITLNGIRKEKCIHSKRYDESTIMEYVPEIGRILLLMPYDLDGSLPDTAALPLVPFLVDPQTGNVEMEAQKGAFPSLNARSLVKNKFFHSERLGALVMVPTAGSNVLIRKFA